MIDIVRYRSLYFLFSLLVIAGGLATYLVEPRLAWSIEFTGGAAVDAVFTEPVTREEVEFALAGLGFPGTVVQAFGGPEVFVRLPPEAVGREEAVRAALEQGVGELVGFDFSLISAAVAQETVRNGLIAVALAVLGVLAYVVWAFRGVPHSFHYGVAAIVALVHDMLAAFAVAGVAVHFVHIELSTMFLVGLLTLLGYSINDTIVVFDRIRENLLRETARDLSTTVNFSILETMGRSLNTSFTTLVVLLAIWMLGPATIRDFLLVMIVGVTAGSYSSVFTASQIVVTWETRSLGSLPRWVRLPGRSSARPAEQ